MRVRVPPRVRKHTRPGGPKAEASDSGSEGWGFESLSGYAMALSAPSRRSSAGQSVALIRRRPVVRFHPARPRVVAQLGQRARFGTERSPVRIRPTRRNTDVGGASRKPAPATVPKTVGASARDGSTPSSSALARVAQWEERRSYKPDVPGSSPGAGTARRESDGNRGDHGVPVVHTRLWPWRTWVRLPVITPSPRSSADRAPDSESGRRRFDSGRGHVPPPASWRSGWSAPSAKRVIIRFDSGRGLRHAIHC